MNAGSPMKKQKPLFALFLLVAISCRQGWAAPGDPYAFDGESFVLPGTPLHGKAIPADASRPPRPASADDRARWVGAGASGLIITNTLHLDEYWAAHVRPECIESVSLQTIPLLQAKNAGRWGMGWVLNALGTKFQHSQLVFRFRDDCAPRLFGQKTGDERRRDSPALVFSLDAQGDDAMPFSPRTALRGGYVSVPRFESLTHTEFRYRLKLRLRIYEVPLTMTPEERVRLFEGAVREGHARGYSTPYSMWAENCATTLFDLIAEATDTRPYGCRWALTGMSRYAWGRAYLLRRVGIEGALEEALGKDSPELALLRSDPQTRLLLRQSIAQERARRGRGPAGSSDRGPAPADD